MMMASVGTRDLRESRDSTCSCGFRTDDKPRARLRDLSHEEAEGAVAFLLPILLELWGQAELPSWKMLPEEERREDDPSKECEDGRART